MNRTLILIGLGGLLGSVFRYWIVSFFLKIFSSPFPYGTFVVNIIGCLLVGVFYGLSKHYDWFNPTFVLFFITGFCGGFTTFSSFAYENITLLQSGNYLTFGIYSVASFVLGLLAAFGGLTLVKITL